jgi:hypothetical protein
MKIIVSTLAALATFAVPAGAAGAGDAATQGYIYGTVETESGASYTGLLRWDTEESFWDDHFNSTKTDLPYLEEHRDETRKRNRIKIFGVTVGYRWDESAASRQFLARFGDIREIRARRSEKIEVTMQDGETHTLDGGSNDIGGTIAVDDESLGRVKLEWAKIEKIVFKPTPATVEPEGYRLFGKVETAAGEFEGFVQWDLQECLSTDKLDGASDDGDLSIEMGRIAAIEKRNRSGSWIEMKDGRKLLLEGTNDVDASLRGIFVEDERYGRVMVSWEAFERLEFREVGKSGRGYESYAGASPLRGTVTDYEDRTLAGRLVFDLDETASWELLNGNREGVEYHIPFALIRAVEPQRGEASRVVLASGAELVLSDGQDVSESNDGVVVVRDDGRQVYLPWSDVKRVEFR